MNTLSEARTAPQQAVSKTPREPDGESLRDRIVRAARICYAQKSAEKTTMEDIASQANVGRATVYRHFANREAVLLAVFRVEVRNTLSALAQVVGHPDSFCDLFLQYLMFVVRYAQVVPTHKMLFTESGALWVSRTFISDAETLQIALDFFLPSFNHSRQRGELCKDTDLADLIEYSGRLLISLLLIPGPINESEPELRAYFERHVIRHIRANPPPAP
jgi:AcrR family transcriptional regulator